MRRYTIEEFKSKLNKIYCCDCLKGMVAIPDESIDMILCDLPYTFKGKQRVTGNKWDLPIDMGKLWEEYKRLIKSKGVIVLTATNPFASYLVMSNLKMFKYEWIWEKCQGTNFVHAKFQPLKSHEQVLIFGKAATTFNKKALYMKYNPQFIQGKPYIIKRSGRMTKNLITSEGKELTSTFNFSGKRYPKTIQRFSRDKIKIHPTQKPVALFEYLIRTYTNEGDLVLDNCIGSGTTAVACKKSNRNFIGFEILQKYIDIANKRLAEIKD